MDIGPGDAVEVLVDVFGSIQISSGSVHIVTGFTTIPKGWTCKHCALISDGAAIGVKLLGLKGKGVHDVHIRPFHGPELAHLNLAVKEPAQ